MRFTKFIPWQAQRTNKRPGLMEVGEIVKRKGIKESTKRTLKYMMKQYVDDGWEFSIHDKGDVFAIRRDK